MTTYHQLGNDFVIILRYLLMRKIISFEYLKNINNKVIMMKNKIFKQLTEIIPELFGRTFSKVSAFAGRTGEAMKEEGAKAVTYIKEIDPIYKSALLTVLGTGVSSALVSERQVIKITKKKIKK
jgi:hypothetical protein